MVVFLCQRTVQGNQIRLLKQRIKIHILDKIQILVGVLVIADHAHAKALTDSCHCHADLACSHDSRRLAVQVHAHQPRQVEIVLPALDVRLMHMPVGSQHQCHGMLRHCLRGVTGHPHHRNAALMRRVQIYIIKARTAHQHQFRTAFCKRVDRLFSQIHVDKRADRLVPVRKPRRLRA